ncbi:MAG: response regulator [Acidobacteriaceae bacterium]|nr:response regulator [Acidobacteriaceae bacterium]
MADSTDEFTPEQKNQIPVNRNDVLWAGTAGLALLVVIALALFDWRGVQVANKRAVSTRELVSDLRKISRLTDEAETGQRGYLLRAQEDYLEPYTSAVQEIPHEISKLQSNVEAQPHRKQINELTRLIADKLAELKQTIDLRRTAGLPAALAVVQTDRGKKTMDRIRALITSFEEDIDASANAQAQEVARRARNAALLTSAASLTLFTLFTVAYFQLRRQRETAEAANRAKSVFLASMSHELRTPLNAIIGYSEMLMEEAEDSAQSSLVPDLAKIQLAGKHLLMLINSVLDLSKIEAGKMDLYVETIGVVSLVEEVASVVRPLADKNGNRLVLQIDPHAGSVQSDGTKLRQTLYNLLSNACKFTQNGSITFGVRREKEGAQETVVFTVEDTGIGMTPAQIERSFQPFTQADSSTSRRFGGTGLGLALSRRFVQILGGSLSVESRPKAGSTFTVRIPVDVTGQEARGAHSVVAEPAPANNLVLAIDDEPSVGELLSRSLAKHGFRVHPAYTGEEGVRLARKLRPVAITLDVMMPGMDGWMVLSMLKADAELREIPVVMLTISDNQNLGYTLGATDYLSKPIDRERLLSVLMRYHTPESAASALVVEDDPNSRELLRRALEGEGWKARTAENGRVALDLIAQQRPGVILLDLMMPEMDGFEFVSALRQQPENRNIPIVVITAKDLTSGDRVRLNGYVSRILQKGAFQIEDLLAEVSRLVATRVQTKPAAPLPSD